MESPASKPQKALPIPPTLIPDMVTRKVIAAASRRFGICHCGGDCRCEGTDQGKARHCFDKQRRRPRGQEQ